MKNLVILALLILSIPGYSQKYNKNVFSKKTDKYGDFYITTDPTLIIDAKNEKAVRFSLNEDGSCYPEDQLVEVNLDKFDFVKNKITLPDTSGFMYFSDNGMSRVGVGIMNYKGEFLLPPVYTTVLCFLTPADRSSPSDDIRSSYTTRYRLFGQKLKNGNCRVMSEITKTDTAYYQMGEFKDVSVVNSEMLLFKGPDGKLGIMDWKGAVIHEASIDTFFYEFKYKDYGRWHNEKYIRDAGYWKDYYTENLEYNFEVDRGYSWFWRDAVGNNAFLCTIGNTVKVGSLVYMTRPIENPVISRHVISNSGQGFYALSDKNGLEIINVNGSPPNPSWKYAYLETIRRDTTEGESQLWNFDPKSEYLNPFVSVTLVPKVEETASSKPSPPVKQETEEEIRLRKLKEDPTNYANVVAGRYKVIQWVEYPNTYYSATTGSTENWFNIRMEDKNLVTANISFKGKTSSYDPYITTLTLNASLLVSRGVIKAGFQIGAQDIEGYFFSDPGYETQKTKVEAIGKLSNLSGSYNPTTGELILEGEKQLGGRISIKATRVK